MSSQYRKRHFDIFRANFRPEVVNDVTSGMAVQQVVIWVKYLMILGQIVLEIFEPDYLRDERTNERT